MPAADSTCKDASLIKPGFRAPAQGPTVSQVPASGCA